MRYLIFILLLFSNFVFAQPTNHLGKIKVLQPNEIGAYKGIDEDFAKPVLFERFHADSNSILLVSCADSTKAHFQTILSGSTHILIIPSTMPHSKLCHRRKEPMPCPCVVEKF